MLKLGDKVTHTDMDDVGEVIERDHARGVVLVWWFRAGKCYSEPRDLTKISADYYGRRLCALGHSE